MALVNDAAGEPNADEREQDQTSYRSHRSTAQIGLPTAMPMRHEVAPMMGTMMLGPMAVGSGMRLEMVSGRHWPVALDLFKITADLGMPPVIVTVVLCGGGKRREPDDNGCGDKEDLLFHHSLPNPDQRDRHRCYAPSFVFLPATSREYFFLHRE